MLLAACLLLKGKACDFLRVLRLQARRDSLSAGGLPNYFGLQEPSP